MPHGSSIGVSWEPIGTPWETHGRLTGDPWATIEPPMGDPHETHGWPAGDPYEPVGLLWESMGPMGLV